MSLTEILVYVVYAFAAVFIVGALFVLIKIFTPNKETKQKKKEEKAQIIVEQKQEETKGFFGSKNSIQFDLQSDNENNGVQLDTNSPPNSIPNSIPQNVPSLGNNIGRKPVTNSTPVEQRSFSKPQFANTEVSLPKEKEKENKFNLPSF